MSIDRTTITATGKKERILSNRCKEIVAIKSVEGSYFEIGRTRSGYYLKNSFTEIPNEFELYSIDVVKKLFDDLCERVPECMRVDHSFGCPNDCICVVYSDRTEQLYHAQDGIGMNLAAFATETAKYVEFYEDPFYYWGSPLMTLEHLRRVCRSKREDYAVFFKAIRDYIEDDGIDLHDVTLSDGTIEIHELVLGFDFGADYSIMPDGKIGKTGKLRFIELMKKNDVSVFRNE